MKRKMKINKQKKQKQKGKIIKIRVFSYNKLSQEAKQKVLEKFRNINVDDFYDNSYLIDELIEKVKTETGIILDKKDIQYEMFSRSNSIYCDGLVIENALRDKYREIEHFFLPKKFGMFCSYLGGGMCSSLCRSDFNVDEISFYPDDESDDDLAEVIKEKLRVDRENKIKEKIAEDLSKIQDIFKEFYNKFYEDYNYQISDEAVKDTIEANDYQFLETGEQF